MKHCIILLLSVIASFSAMGQDMITTTTGDKIACKVARVTKKNVKYRLADSDDTALHSVPKETVYVIRYEDGGKEYFAENKVDDDNDEGKWDKDAMKDAGRDDANSRYHGYKAAKAGTAVTAALGGPILGLVPAIICSSTPPQDETLNASE